MSSQEPQEETVDSPTTSALLPSESTSKRSAFSELMSPKPKHSTKARQPKQIRTAQPSNPKDVRNGLLPYIVRPESISPNLMLRCTENSVLIRDAYPKSLLHLLLLPRDASKYNLHPHAAFADPAFLQLLRSEAAECIRLAASELSRLLSSSSASCEARLEAMNSASPPSELPAGRDFVKELRVGVHAHPSMNHLHVHIISPDMSSDSMKHRKHYNSFNTDFFIPLEDFPLAEDDIRREVPYQNANLSRDYKCWRCGSMFENKFKELKEHLTTEFIEWQKE